MMSDSASQERVLVPANELCSSIFDGTHDSPKRQLDGRKLVTGKQLKNNEILIDDSYFISEEDYQKIIIRSGVQIGDVLFTTIGTVGEVCIIKAPAEYAIKNIGVFRPKHIQDSLWLYYYFLSPQGKAMIESLKKGSTQQFMGLNELRNFPIPTPGDVTFRAAQTTILDLLDSKILINRQTSSTFEKLSTAIFKSWFIDFDPVHAKLRGEQPAGMDAETAALFPDSFEESERGLIPSGWKTGTVLDLCSKVVNGSTPSRGNRDFWALGKFPWFKTGELADNFLIDSSECISEMAVNRSSVKVLPKGSVLMAIYAAPTVGRLGILTRAAAFNQACTGMVPLEEVGSGFLYLKLKESRGYFNSLAIGAAQQNISKGVVENCPVTIPDRLVFAAFNELVSPMFSMIENNAVQNANLASIRDALLPRLISGDLEIPDELLVD